tara:strand:- start:25 stop:426 length:402 start_codon:yes stop_codon:yes gene_type:complete
MKTYKLTKWGAQRLLSYYLDIYDWGTTLYNEEKYTPLLKEVLQKTMKTGQLEIPEKYPEIKNILEQDMRSGLEMDEMNVDEISSWATHPYRNSSWKQEIGCSKSTLLRTIDQYLDIIKEFSKDGVYDIQFKKE